MNQPNPRFITELLEGVKERTGMDLETLSIPTVNQMTLNRDFQDRYYQRLVGPFKLKNALFETFELQVFIAYTIHADAPKVVYVQFLVMDCEGDFLNDNAHPLNVKPTNFELS